MVVLLVMMINNQEGTLLYVYANIAIFIYKIRNYKKVSLVNLLTRQFVESLWNLILFQDVYVYEPVKYL